MKDADPGIAGKFANAVTTLSEITEIRSVVSGSVWRWTSHDRDLTVGGNVYIAAPGVERSAILTRADLSVPSVELRALEHAIEAEIIDRGWVDNANITISVVDSDTPSGGTMVIFSGTLGQVQRTREGYEVEGRGQSQRLSQQIGEFYSRECRADLGDARCKVDLSAYTYTGYVGTLDGDRGFEPFVTEHQGTTYPTGTAFSEPEGWFDQGVLTWASGENVGLSMEVHSYTQAPNPRRMNLYLPPPSPITIGDAFTVYAGCNKLITTCRDKFGNVVNFRGEPYVPGAQPFSEHGIRVAALTAIDIRNDLADPESDALRGPRDAYHSELSSQVGAPIPVAFGDISVQGNIIWASIGTKSVDPGLVDRALYTSRG